MHTMRDLITLLEAPRAKAKPVPAIAFNRDDLAGKLMNLQSIFMGVRHGFRFTAEWTEMVVAQVKQAKLDFEAGEAQDRARYGDEHEPTVFPVKDIAVESADKVFSTESSRYSIHSDTRTMEREYQDRKTTNPDDPMDFVEDSDFLRFLKAQDEFAIAIERVVPSKPSTYSPAIAALQKCLELYSNNSQDEELIWSESLQELVSRAIPLLRFSLKNL